MSSEIAIKVENLGKCYQIYDKPSDRLLQMVTRGRKQYFREFWALKDVSFEIKKGETIGIIGRNGSGKSTLLQLICGTLNPTAGQICTTGRVAALLELGSGFNPEFTGLENVYLNGTVLGLTKEQIDARLPEIIAFADIGDFVSQPVKTYSSGMVVRLAFAVIAHVDADILIIDEALAVGDALFTQKCMRFIRSYREKHALLFVSHDTSSVINLCDRAIWLDQGKEKKSGAAKMVCEAYLNSIFTAVTAPTDAGIKTTNPALQLERTGQPDLQWRDQRTDFINASPLRNDIEVFKFSQHKTDTFGGETTRITSVVLLDVSGNALSWIVGGERVCLRIEAETLAPVEKPILGFFIKDRLGQTLFGDNTYISYADKYCAIAEGETIAAEFEFYMPWLAQGDYVIQVAIADGDQNNHRQLHWLHDALAFRSVHSPVSTGIIGIPMIDIHLKKS